MTHFHESLTRLSAGSDADLKDYFTVTESIRQLADFGSNKVLAVGLKGIGKTATFRHFTEMRADDDVVVIGINEKLYKLYLPSMGLNFAACRDQFEHDLIVEALRGISESGAMKARIGTKNVNAAKAEVSSYRRVLEAAAGAFRGVSILGCGFTIAPPQKVLVGLRPRDEVRASFELLKRICAAGASVRIVVDDPEFVFSAAQELDVGLIGGFFHAALGISRQIPQLKVIVLTKPQVFDPVERRTPDFDKYPDSRVDLSWTRDELVELISGRLQWARTEWTQAFAMPETKARAFLASRVCDGIRNGPRDLLRWVALARTHAQADQVAEASFEAVRKETAKYSLKSLGQSFEALYPRITDVVATIFRQEPSRCYKLAELRGHIETLLAKDPTMIRLANSPWMQQETHYTLPELLLRVGGLALGVGKRLILPYEREYSAEQFEAADYVRLVPSLVEAL